MICDFKKDAFVDKHHEIKEYENYDLQKIFELEALLKKAKNGESSAVKEICIRFNGMIINMCRSFYIKGYTMEDMIQEGRLSLIKAVGSYDLSSEYPFASYARSAILKNFYYKIRSSTKKVSCCSIYSCNKEGNELIDIIPSRENIEEDFMGKQWSIQLKNAVGKLSRKEKKIIIWCYVENKSLKEYAVKKDITYKRAVCRRKRALYNLRKYLEDYI